MEGEIIIKNCQICNEKLTHIQIIRKNKMCSWKCSAKERSQRILGTHPKSTQRQCHLCSMIFWVENWNSKKRKFCSMQCSSLSQKETFKGKIIGKRYSMMGANNPNWAGGSRDIYKQIRSSFEYKLWRKQVFKRDNYACVFCGDSKGGNLEADHIKPFAVLLREFNINIFEEALECEELWDINNGRTLCKSCHKQTPTWGPNTLHYLLGRRELVWA